MKIINNRAKIFNDWESISKEEIIRYINSVVIPDVIGFCKDSGFTQDTVMFVGELLNDIIIAYDSNRDLQYLATSFLYVEMVINERDAETIPEYLAGFEPPFNERRRILYDFSVVFNETGLYPTGKKYFELQKNYFGAVISTLFNLGYQPPLLWEKCISQRVNILKAEGFKINKEPFSQEHIDRYKSNNKQEVIIEAVRKRNSLLKVKKRGANVKLLPYDDSIINKVFSKQNHKAEEDLS